MKFRQFLDNYRIWKQRVRNPNAIYEKGDLKYAAFRGLIYLIPGVLFYGIVFYIIIHL